MSASQVLASFPTAAELYEKTADIKLSTGCDQLDALLQGGIPFFPITEICGEAGVGKSQLLLKLALTAQLPVGMGGLGSGSIILSTEGRVPVQRLRHYLQTCAKLQPLVRSGGGREEEEVLSRIFIDDQIADKDALWLTFSERLPKLLAKHDNIRLVVVDSITSVFRGEFLEKTSESMAGRNDWFFGLAGFMRQYFDAFGCMFVCANQVTTDLSIGSLKPALGLVWSHCVNQRLLLEFASRAREEEDVSDKHPAKRRLRRRRRCLSIEFCPSLPCGLVTTELVIGSFGLELESKLDI